MSPSTNLHRRRHKLLSIGLSFLVNAAVFGVLAHMVTVSPRPSEKYLAIELESAPVVHIPQTEAPKPKLIKQVPPAPKSTVKPKPTPPKTSGSTRQKFFTLPILKNRTAKTTNPGPAGTAIAPTPASTSGGGGTSASGPGAPSGSGNGGGTTSSGSPGGHGAVNTPGTSQGSGDERGDHVDPAPAPPPPAPKGESRSAKAVSQPKPAYPQDARDEEVEGTTVLLATISTDGHVVKAKVEKSSGDRRLDKAAEAAVKRWTYSPCLKDGTAVESTVRVNVHFRLE